MKVSSANKALILKEWNQNRLLFILQILLFVIIPVVSTILIFAGGIGIFRLSSFQANLMNKVFEILNLKNTLPQSLAMIFAIIMGINLLNKERTEGTLEFLVTFPIGRKDILNAKYFLGVGFITLISFLNFLLILAVVKCFSIQYSILYIIKYFIITWAVLSLIHSMSFLAATLSGNQFSAWLLLFILYKAPVIILDGILALFNPNPVLVNAIHEAEKYSFPINYLSSVNLENSIFIIQVGLMLVFTVIIYILSTIVFEKNNFENNKRALIFGDEKIIKVITASILTAYLLTFIIKININLIPGIILALFIGTSLLFMKIFSICANTRK
ncbi:MAG: ABC transporter permease [Deltaproteobacteria bacterium]